MYCRLQFLQNYNNVALNEGKEWKVDVKDTCDDCMCLI